MLNKKRTAGWARLRLLLVLPLGGAMLCTSTMAFTKDYGYLDLLPEKSFSNTLQEVPKVENIKKQNAPKVENIKKDQVKFPPPIVKNDRFTPLYAKDKATGKPVLREKRLILVNGKAVENLATFYGVYDADNVKYSVNESSTAKKYGDKGKNGVVEITGKNIKYYNKVTYPSPPPVEPPPPGYQLKKGVKKDQIKFPPPIVKLNKTYFYPNRTVDKEGNINGIDKRYIVINSKKVEDITTFFGVTDASRINYLNGPTAIKKYGKDAKYGAVEINGDNIKYVKSIADGPTPPVMEQIKFPPPIVKPDKKDVKKISNPQTSLKINERENIIASLKSETNAKVNQLALQREIEVAIKKQIQDKRIESAKNLHE